MKRAASKRDSREDRSVEPKRRPAASAAHNELSWVALSARDKAQELELSKDQLSVRNGDGGYRMARATHGVHGGSYFYEVEVTPSGSDNSHVRIGWSTRQVRCLLAPHIVCECSVQGALQAPCGFDQWSFGYRDIAGSKVHNGVREDNYGESYGVGDIIGCFLHLDDQEPANNQMRFFKNGVDQGIAYQGESIASGMYFPAVSLYMRAAVSVNFGPSFILRHDIYGANAVSELQPLSPEDRKFHDKRILSARTARGVDDLKGLLIANNSAAAHGNTEVLRAAS